MSRQAYVQKNVRNVDPAIRLAVVSEALDRQVTISDVIGVILADHYKRRYELSGEKPMGIEVNGVDQFMLRLPQDIVMAIVVDAKASKTTESSVVQKILAEFYKLPYEPVYRGGKRRRRA